MNSELFDFKLAVRHDVPALAASFAHDGFVALNGFLEDQCAHALVDHLTARDDWLEVLDASGTVCEIRRQDFLSMSADQHQQLDKLVHASARDGFQFRFRTVRISDSDADRRAGGTLLDRFAQFLNSPEVLELLRQVVGRSDVRHIDAQATTYGAGNFLTDHDDDVAGKHRCAAYVLGLSSNWRPDWGGLLLFQQGDEVRGFVPAFNSLRLFSVPRQHSVSFVPPFVDAERMSITGWLRTEYPK